jgi:hypothetical protein
MNASPVRRGADRAGKARTKRGERGKYMRLENYLKTINKALIVSVL